MLMVLINCGCATICRLFTILMRAETSQEWWRGLSRCWRCTIPFSLVHRSVQGMASPSFSLMSPQFELLFGLFSSCGELVYHCCADSISPENH